MEVRKMKKQFLVFLIFLGLSQLNAETLLQVYPSSWFELITGRHTMLNTFKKEEKPKVTFNTAIEIRQTVVKSSFADLMVAGGLSFYFENYEHWKLRSVNLSTGLTFGYGYNEKKRFFKNANITIYPLYEFSPVVFWKTLYPWKFALDINWELIQFRPSGPEVRQFKPLSINLYVRTIGVYTENGIRVPHVPDFGLTLGWLINKITYD